MQNTYLGYHFTVEPKDLGSEILIAELGEKPFESFIESDFGIVAYIRKENWTEDILEDMFILNSPQFTIRIRLKKSNRSIGMRNGRRILNQLMWMENAM